MNSKSNQFGDGLYHRDIYLPADLTTPFVGRFAPEYTDHAIRAAHFERYGSFALPSALTVKAEHIVEVEIRGGVAVKAVVRIAHEENYDLVLVVNRPTSSFAVVRTVWLNERNDNHGTLRAHVYRKAA